MSEPRLIVKYRDFRGTLATWEELFEEAAEFATSIGSERLVSISHSADRTEGVIAVWYWGVPDAAGDR